MKWLKNCNNVKIFFSVKYAHQLVKKIFQNYKIHYSTLFTFNKCEKRFSVKYVVVKNSFSVKYAYIVSKAVINKK